MSESGWGPSGRERLPGGPKASKFLVFNGTVGNTGPPSARRGARPHRGYVAGRDDLPGAG